MAQLGASTNLLQTYGAKRLALLYRCTVICSYKSLAAGQHRQARTVGGRMLPTKVWQPLIVALGALGVLGVAAAKWHHLLVRHPITALVLALGWLAICGIIIVIRKVLAVPAQRRLEQAGNA